MNKTGRQRKFAFFIFLLLFMSCLIASSQTANSGTIVLENNRLRVELLRSYPYVKRYILKSNSEVIYGDIVNEMFYAYIYYNREFYNIEPQILTITESEDQVCYHMQAVINTTQAVRFDIGYLLSGNKLSVRFDNIVEIGSYKLIHVRSPDLLTLYGNQLGATLIFPFAEGRLIDVATSSEGWEEISLNYDGWNRPLLMSMLYHDKIAGIVHYDHLDMELWSRIYDHQTMGRLASIGMKFYYRYEPSNFSAASFIDVFDSETTSMTTQLVFTDDYDKDGDLDWMDGAKLIRDGFSLTPETQYLSSFITKIGRTGITHISEHLNTLKKLYHLTDHNRIHAYLLDYNRRIFELFGEESDLDYDFGTLADLKETFRIAEESYNTLLGFHDNYHDYYPGTPDYDESLRAIQDNGTPYPGWPLPSFSESYWRDPYDYTVNKGLNRVRKTLARYPIKSSHHIDVLSLVYPLDYSPLSPSSRERNRRGWQLLIDEFNKQGVDVTSEGLTWQYAKSGIGWYVNTQCLLSNPLSYDNAEIIPLIEFIFHGKSLYGLYEDIYYDQLPDAQVTIYTFLEPLLLGANSSSHITFLTANDLEIDKFYLIDLPWMALNQRFMDDYEAHGNYRKISYDNDTYVEIDYKKNTYKVQVDGEVIGQNYTTIYPKNSSTYLIYSKSGNNITFNLPKTWFVNGPPVLKLNKLTEEGVGDSISFQTDGNKITFNALANTPYKLIYSDPSTTPKIGLNRTRFNFGAVVSGAQTSEQSLLIFNKGGGSLDWRISDDSSWLSCTPTSGTDAGIVNITVDPSGLSTGTYTGLVTISSYYAENSPKTISVYLTVKTHAQTQAPFGVFSTPVNGSTVSSSIPITGWVLDDVGVTTVKIYRADTGNPVYIGDAVFVEGARPDVEQAYPDYPLNYKSGWGYMMLTNFLPNGGNGTFKFHAIATDIEGHKITLGTKTIICDNANAVKPFGAIDTPTQGGTASGSNFINWGWVLTPQPNSIPTDGSTINVYVDGINLGNPTYNVYRSDIANIFTEYANSDGAIGYFYLDTTTYENGVHTIQWTAKDSGGNSDGIGSRYFTIQNTGSARSGMQVAYSKMEGNKKKYHQLFQISDIPIIDWEPIKIKKGFREDCQYRVVNIDESGIFNIKIKELELIEIELSNESQLIEGYTIVGNQLRPLPIGSTLDNKTSKFYWHSGPGFVGYYHFVFIETDKDGKVSKKNIIVRIEPKFLKSKQ